MAAKIITTMKNTTHGGQRKNAGRKLQGAVKRAKAGFTFRPDHKSILSGMESKMRNQYIDAGMAFILGPIIEQQKEELQP